MSTPAAGSPTTVEFQVSGMHCPSCVALIEESLLEHPGVESASVSLELQRAVASFDPNIVGIDDLRAVIVGAGYTVT
ncbi:MAG TPA: heavy-metal-associated domain-containing protein [Acidimicrobiales bacterium]|nr:heavy-metal-associated domain-containing protein [Acidimicrobiales bacterium]